MSQKMSEKNSERRKRARIKNYNAKKIVENSWNGFGKKIEW